MSGRECRRIRAIMREEGVTPREGAATVAAHLAGCAGCRAYAAQERAARAVLATTYGRVAPLPLGLARRSMRRWRW